MMTMIRFGRRAWLDLGDGALIPPLVVIQTVIKCQIGFSGDGMVVCSESQSNMNRRESDPFT
jgi:hypothetical protein